ncbi:MAG: imidazoleglycerol-phosphate dehydratase HisB [Ignavibacteria bacterium]|nr:imidazoleglycerol-phosphate dehydratase HisB [Ignavibacteria bacterium]
MKQVIIDGRFVLEYPENPVCAGLIGVLNKIAERGYEIVISSTMINEMNDLFCAEEIEALWDPMAQPDCKWALGTLREQVSKLLERKAQLSRVTRETSIDLTVNLDQPGMCIVQTGIGFFDHMLEQIARHGNISLLAECKGDLHVDEHHTVEDVGIVLGEALNLALGEKKGIQRYAFSLPMDDADASCLLDLGGRAYCNLEVKFTREKVGEFPTELTAEFFRAVAMGLKANIHLQASGLNDHHKIEALFKAFAKALNEACRVDNRAGGALPSTKGIL